MYIRGAGQLGGFLTTLKTLFKIVENPKNVSNPKPSVLIDLDKILEEC